MNETETCPTCKGSGRVMKPCELCKGSGYVGESRYTDHGNGYSSASHTQKRCPNGCQAPIMRLAAGVVSGD